jgi:uncharacterized lipoprotein YmbA
MRSAYSVVLLVAVVFSQGCFRSPSSRFYSLISQQESEAMPVLSSEGVALEVSSIIFPRYLDDPRIAVRTGSNEITRDEYERWVEDLTVNFRQALLNDLGRELKSSNVFSTETYSQRRGSQVLQVEVLQFDVTDEGRAILKVRWAVGARREDLASAPLVVSEYVGVVERDTTEARVAALSMLIDKLAFDVSRRVGS